MNASLFADLAKEALLALRTHRLRSALTLLGVVIGVASVVAMVSIGAGVRESVTQSISALGSRVVMIQSGASQQGGFQSAMGSVPTLTLGDIGALSRVPGVQAIAPVNGLPVQVVGAAGNRNVQLTGTWPAYLRIHDWTVRDGRGITERDVRAGLPVALLGHTVAQALFGAARPVGQIVRLSGRPFRVVGVLAPKGQSMGGRDQDDAVIVPITAAERLLSGSPFAGRLTLISVQLVDGADSSAVSAQMAALLRERHRLRPAQADDFSVRDMAAIASTVGTVTGTLTLMLGAIGSIALLVGGIGIMNIMLVSVVERTREIGLRRALGATRESVLLQFIVESLVLSALGCLIGILVGQLASWAAGLALGVDTVISTASLLASVAVALVVGVVFGLWPALQAARLRPIEALRQRG